MLVSLHVAFWCLDDDLGRPSRKSVGDRSASGSDDDTPVRQHSGHRGSKRGPPTGASSSAKTSHH